MTSWQSIKLADQALNLSTVLRCGQTFRWKAVDDTWTVGIRGRIVVLKQDGTNLLFKSQPETVKGEVSTEEFLRDYFQLDVDLSALHDVWAKDKHFPPSAKESGIRILRQDPFETLCSFICSSNNNIKRISKMVSLLCDQYGDQVGTLDNVVYHQFPRPEQLAKDGVEGELRKLGFGYRAKFLAETAAKVASYHDYNEHFEKLRSASYEEAHQALLEFKGVGPKVSDCVCLMALDKHDCVPIDTHMFQVAKNAYKLKFKENMQGYKSVQHMFKNIWGSHAGWAQSIVFTKDLANLSNGITIASQVKNEEISAQAKALENMKDEVATKAPELVVPLPTIKRMRLN